MRSVAACIAVVVSVAGTTFGQISELWDNNAYVRVNTGTTGDRIGMDRWEIDGTNHLYNQWFWFRVGDNGPEQRINSLAEVGRSVQDTNTFIDPRPDTFNIRYGTASTYWIDVRFSLTGGATGSNASDILETISITNNTGGTLPFRFFQYSDFDLNNDVVDDAVWVNPFNRAWQRDGGMTLSETVVSPAPFAHEVNVYPTTINALDDANPTTLNGTSSINDGVRRDYTWAFQWNFDLASGGTYIISKDKLITPAPGAAVALGLGGMLAARRRRR